MAVLMVPCLCVVLARLPTAQFCCCCPSRTVLCGYKRRADGGGEADLSTLRPLTRFCAAYAKGCRKPLLLPLVLVLVLALVLVLPTQRYSTLSIDFQRC